ncbi:allophanate hydrolase-related protein [Ethanoligenens harbinense]|uniref:allophanate hydrolase-related protein n=1 Tax=Ethanoligenens harbinense TaxID=253239 RepID=UPI0001C52433|nr:hypothetical protein [Ethanoligenens harbinense]AVQ96928.1 hypothetical protein CXQ68_12350 [Ethanoligenens harbinense YUAN-3]AYF39589.1 hypothetical protein CXP51_12245 [Ethanoligenens harbinense]AYF42415.1 hypothetical protein CN246_12795 [Ethanoligenens harbinense]QCN93168.1 hypothetical protein DRA42_12385 [Ethanoligenens harbinense]
MQAMINENDTVTIAVCGLHMRGYPLESQLLERNAHFVREDKTAPIYRLYLLPMTPPKPGLIRTEKGGSAISVEIWEMPIQYFGGFVKLIPSPLGIGKVILNSGEIICGFICEGFASEAAEDITSFGGWKKRFPPAPSN